MFAAPEILDMDSSNLVSDKTDLWACGLICNLLVTGTIPFEGKTHKELLQCVEQNPDIDFSGVSHNLKKFLQGLVKVDVEDRCSLNSALKMKFVVKAYGVPDKINDLKVGEENRSRLAE